MMAYGERLRRTRIDLAALADYWIDRVERLLRACVRDRERLPAAQEHRRAASTTFMADDLGTGAPRSTTAPACRLTAAARAEMTAFLPPTRAASTARSSTICAPTSGSIPAAVRARFGFYFERFAVQAED